MKEILIATKNKGKVRDFEELFLPKGIQVVSLLDYPEILDVEETGNTFRENAIIKAETIAKHLNLIVIADDSGLSIDALDGRPGVYSARYAGEAKDDNENINKVLTELSGIPMDKRSAQFHCALALTFPGIEFKTIVVEGTCKGKITETPIGEHGFGYDPIFFVKEKQKTMAQLTKAEKNEISHRRNALELLAKEINGLF